MHPMMSKSNKCDYSLKYWDLRKCSFLSVEVPASPSKNGHGYHGYPTLSSETMASLMEGERCRACGIGSVSSWLRLQEKNAEPQI